VTLELTADQLAYWNVDEHRFVIELGRIEIMIGASSADVKLRRMVEVRK
jgi:hypothetical protein